MSKKYLARVPVALAFLAVSASMAWGDDALSGQLRHPAGIEGVWRVTRHGVNCVTGGEISTFPALMTFHADGTVSGQGVPPGSTNAFGPAEHGVWHRKEYSHDFTFRLLSYGYDDNGVFAGSVEVSGTGQLTGANTFAYKATVAFFDANGNPLFSGCGAATGVRF